MSGKDLGWFFSQWLTRSGVPKLTGMWQYDAAAKQVKLEIAQSQPGEPYRLPLEFGLTIPGAPAMRVEKVELTGASGSFTFPADVEPTDVVLDPNTWLLMEPPALVKR